MSEVAITVLSAAGVQSAGTLVCFLLGAGRLSPARFPDLRRNRAPAQHFSVPSKAQVVPQDASLLLQAWLRSLTFLGRPSKMAQVPPTPFCDSHSSRGNGRIRPEEWKFLLVHSFSLSLSLLLSPFPSPTPTPSTPVLLPYLPLPTSIPLFIQALGRPQKLQWQRQPIKDAPGTVPGTGEMWAPSDSV